MNRVYDSRDLAAYIAQQCVSRKITYDNTKIQQLLYCVFGVMLAWRASFICDESPRCWPHGPSFPKVFNYIYQGGQIACYSYEVENSQDSDIKDAVYRVLDRFAGYTPVELTNWCHQKSSPWDRARVESKGVWNGVIAYEYILSYFQSEVLNKE